MQHGIMNRNRLRSRIPLALIVSLMFALAGCEPNRQSVGAGLLTSAPSALSMSTVRIVPQTLPLIPVRDSRCPVVAPFTSIFDLVVDHRGQSDVFLDQVSFRFVDRSGLGGSPLFFSAGTLTTLFGQMSVRPGGSRTFTFRPQFGCDLLVPRSLLARVTLVDRFGVADETSLTIPIR